MMALEFVVDVTPQGKQRARSGNGHHYTPQKTRDYEALIGLYAKQAMTAAKRDPLTGAVRVHIVARMPMPQSWSQKKRRAMNHMPAVAKPDTDNIAKSICDAMNGIVYLDDKQVWCASVERYWDIKGSVQVVIHTDRRDDACVTS